MDISQVLYYVIAILGLFNFVRILLMLIGSDVYDIRHMLKNRHRKTAKKSRYNPLISIIIPAYNEESGVLRTVESALASTYKNIQVIVVNDGSKDRTQHIVRGFQRKNPRKVTLVNQANAGKAMAINRAVKYWAKGKLVMVVDADSLVHPEAVANMVAHFRNRRIIAAASNVKVIPSNKLLGIAQQFEYLISYRMKRALTVMNMEYIVGGVGSTFRRSALLKVGLYDTDTMTEDIDLTVKLIREYGNKSYKIHYAADALTYTEHVLKFKSLIRQRFRWKYGRMQTLIKNQQMFFNLSKRYDKRLTWYQLPYAVMGELSLLIEPILVGYILWVTVSFGDITSLVSVYVIVTSFVFLILLAESTESFASKIKCSIALPLVYVLMYAITIVEFAALMQSIRNGRQLMRRQMHHGAWEHVERSGGAVKL